MSHNKFQIYALNELELIQRESTVNKYNPVSMCH